MIKINSKPAKYIRYFIRLTFNFYNNIDYISEPFKKELKMDFKLVPAEEEIRNLREAIGIALGIAQGEMKAALKMLKSGFHIDEITKVIEVDRNEILSAALAELIKSGLK
jgi:hypothetical protein